MGPVLFFIFLFITLIAFLLYDKAQTTYIKQLKAEIKELNLKLKKQQEINKNIYDKKSIKE